MKKILYWNQYWDIPYFQFGIGHQPFLDAGCPVSDCIAMEYHNNNRRNNNNNDNNDDDNNNNGWWSSFDAVLVHAPTLDGDDDGHQQLVMETSYWRKPHQRFVYMNMESPLSYDGSHHQTISSFPPNFFNWTMTYRHDSDIPRPYGFFQPRRPTISEPPPSSSSTANYIANKNHYYYPIQFNQPDPPTFIDYNEEYFLRYVLPSKPSSFQKRLVDQKTKLVAWIVSRCESPSRREDYVSELSKYIPVDIMGECGTIPCNATFHDINKQQHPFPPF